MRENILSFIDRKWLAQGKERRKVGRPILHKGDPNDPGLTEKERRTMKRRKANRESAQRVRCRRQEELEETQTRVSTIYSGRGAQRVLPHHVSFGNPCIL